MEKFFKPLKSTLGSLSRNETPATTTTEKRPIQQIEVSDNAIISDPGMRKPINDYALGIRDSIWRRYLAKGPCQPFGHKFPTRDFSGVNRKFQSEWFKTYPWLEYSVSKDRAYCLYCYLFPSDDANKSGGNAYTEIGYCNWKNGSLNLPHHEGGLDSAHTTARVKVMKFQNQRENIDVVLNSKKATCEDEYRTRLTTVVRVSRYLLGEGLPFRGHDESEESVHRGHFLELVSWVCKYNEEINKVMMTNAPKNNQMTSSTIQRDMIECCAKETRKIILNELRDKKFALLLDEARDSSIKEQMAVVVRFLNDNGEIIERFLGVVHVSETSAKGLKNVVDAFFAKNELSLSRLRGQGYDGASNMHGELNGLQALILNENKHAHYIHCFAHQLQLVVVSAAEDNRDIGQFFDYVAMIVNLVGSSCKRLDAFRKAQYEAIVKKLESGEASSGTGKNQEMSLARPGTTRWGSHFKTLLRLFEMWDSVEEVLLSIGNDGDSKKNQRTAKGLVEKMGSFEFVFIGRLMLYILGVKDPISKKLQARNQDIGSAIHMVKTLKKNLQNYRDEGWPRLLQEVNEFCFKHKIKVPNMEDHIESHWLALVDGQPKTHYHHFRMELMITVIDEVSLELNRRFNEANTELLQCIMFLHPSNSFANYDHHAILRLAEIYSGDFSSVEVTELHFQLQLYIDEMKMNPKFSGLNDLGSLAKTFVENDFHTCFPLVYRLIELALILPVATASVERAFSSMNIVKTDLRNKLGDDLLSDCLLCYIEKEIFASVEDEAILLCFQNLASRRNVLPPLKRACTSFPSIAKK